jgi:hypothetical protein
VQAMHRDPITDRCLHRRPPSSPDTLGMYDPFHTDVKAVRSCRAQDEPGGSPQSSGEVAVRHCRPLRDGAAAPRSAAGRHRRPHAATTMAAAGITPRPTSPCRPAGHRAPGSASAHRGR